MSNLKQPTLFDLLEVLGGHWRELEDFSLGVVLVESTLVVGPQRFVVFEAEEASRAVELKERFLGFLRLVFARAAYLSHALHRRSCC